MTKKPKKQSNRATGLTNEWREARQATLRLATSFNATSSANGSEQLEISVNEYGGLQDEDQQHEREALDKPHPVTKAPYDDSDKQTSDGKVSILTYLIASMFTIALDTDRPSTRCDSIQPCRSDWPEKG